MAMTDHGSPDYEYPESEGEGFDAAGYPNGTHEFPDDEFDEFMMDPFGDYEFGNPELMAFDDLDTEGEPGSGDLDGFYSGQRFQRPWATLGDLAGRTAFEWGKGTRVDALFGDNGHSLSVSVSAGQPARTCSAAVQETRELMDALALAAATTEDETEAMGLVAAIVPLSLGLAPKAYRALWPALPVLVRGAMGVTRMLHRRPATRLQIKLLPKIVHDSTAQLARYALRGHDVRRSWAARVLANRTAAALSHQPQPGPKRSGRTHPRSGPRARL